MRTTPASHPGRRAAAWHGPAHAAGRHPVHAAPPSQPQLLQPPQLPADEGFLALLAACRGCGGLARRAEVEARAALWGEGALAVRGWLAQRRVLAFGWQGQSWIPLFQFAREPFAPLPAVARVLAELGDAGDAWELAAWFAAPNAALDGALPAQAIATEPHAVLDAARMLRYGLSAA